MRPVLFRSIILVLTLSGATAVRAQDEGISQRKQEKILAQKAKEEKKEKAKQDKENRKRHLGLQDKGTQKRMKKHARRADRHGPGRHRDPWPARLFRRKR
ncbi:MAG: hypothetical protein IPK70_02585 [Flavobacteriales bacterium]|nr:hypothetical protein [Flavobacteriales bacterium]